MMKKLFAYLTILASINSFGSTTPIEDGREYCGLVNVKKTYFPTTQFPNSSISFFIPQSGTSPVYPELVLPGAITEEFLLNLLAQGQLSKYEEYFNINTPGFHLTAPSAAIADVFNTLETGDKVCLRGVSIITGTFPGTPGELLPNDPNPESGPKYIGGSPPVSYYGIEVLEMKVIN